MPKRAAAGGAGAARHKRAAADRTAVRVHLWTPEEQAVADDPPIPREEWGDLGMTVETPTMQSLIADIFIGPAKFGRLSMSLIDRDAMEATDEHFHEI